jgi:HlyD family secretion protein
LKFSLTHEKIGKLMSKYLTLPIIIFCFFAAQACSRHDSDIMHGYIEGEFVYISSPLGGILETLAVHRGQVVSKSDLLFSLESGAENDAYKKAQAALVYTESEFRRMQYLHSKPGSVSEHELELSRSMYTQDMQQVARLKWDLDQKTQRAPEAGIIFDTLYRQGEMIQAGKPAVVLLPPQNIKIRFFVPERKISLVQQGQEVTVIIDGLKDQLKAKISYISPRTEYTPPVIFSEESREKLVILVEAVFDEKVAATLHPGQPADVKFGL